MDKKTINTLKSYLNNISFERIAGTDGERRARDYIVKVIKSYGLTPEIQYFDIFSFIPLNGEIIVNNKRFNARPFGGFKSFDIDGELQYIEHHSVVENPEGKILMLYYRITPREYRKMLRKKIRGIITVNTPEREEMTGNIIQKIIKSASIPIVSVSYNTGLKLLHYTGKGVRIQGKGKITKSKSANIIVKKSQNPTTIICAHYDTVAYSKGVSDNGGGSAVLLALLNDLGKNTQFIWFGAEEFGLLGSFNYVNNNENKGTEFVINIDVTGDDIGTNNIIVTGDRKLKEWIKRILKRERLYAKIKKNIYSSDSIPFGKIDIPSININRAGGTPSFYIHTEGDSSEVTGYGLYQTYTIVKSIIDNINREGLPEGIKIPGDIRGKINKYIRDKVEFS